jgi:WD repeat-containing protein 45
MDARARIDNSGTPIALSVVFNSTGTHFAVGHTLGYQVFSTDTCKREAVRSLGRGVGLIHLKGTSRILALVGGSKKPIDSPHKVLLWDDSKQQAVREISCTSPVYGVRVLDDRILVMLLKEVSVYNFAKPPKFLGFHHTDKNPLGLCCFSDKQIACPGRNPGHVQLIDLDEKGEVNIIPAHSDPIMAIALSSDGQLLATASEKVISRPSYEVSLRS